MLQPNDTVGSATTGNVAPVVLTRCVRTVPANEYVVGNCLPAASTAHGVEMVVTDTMVRVGLLGGPETSVTSFSEPSDWDSTLTPAGEMIGYVTTLWEVLLMTDMTLVLLASGVCV